MHIIYLEELEPGVYNDHKSDSISTPPEGWAYIPDDFPLPSTFPRLGELKTEEIAYPYEVEVEKTNEETGEVEIVTETRERTMLTVVYMSDGTLPEPVEEPPSEMEQLRADMDYIAVLTGVEL